jgi:hypothetical protein
MMSAQHRPVEKAALVKAAENILDTVKERPGFQDQTSQLRNLVQIAQEESEVPVLRNFIRYQTGRKATQRFWSLIHQGVIQELERIGAAHEEDPAARKLAIQSFFGYLVRHYVYLNEMNKERKRQAGGRS